MTDLGRRLSRLPVPGEEAARRRAATALDAAFAEQRPARARPRRRLAPLAAPLAVLSLTAAALAATGQGDRLARWLTGPPPPAAPLDGLPSPGRLLAVSADGAWLLEADGDRYPLGDYRDVTWSPHGMFVAAVRGRELAAVDPAGEVRWALTAGHRISDPRWGPDGFRIAYRAGPALRVVAGDGSGDRVVASPVAGVPAAWRPDATHVLAYVTAGGAVRTARVDESTTAPTGLVARHATWLGWAGPRRALVASPRRLASTSGRAWRPPAGAAIRAAAVSPGARRVAVLLAGPGVSRVVLLDAGSLRPVRTLATVAGRARELVWSPDGRWLATAQPAAGRWLLIETRPGGGVRALTGLGAALGGPAARVLPRGWCC